MNILGIETSCDETSVAVIEAADDAFAVRANVVSSQIATHAPFGGVVPMLAARDHAVNIGHVFDTALKEADISSPASEIDRIAVTHGPGLGPALLVGLTFARALAQRWNLLIVGVNHMDGHIHSNWLPAENGSPALSDYSLFPALNLLVSGGHTELVLMRTHGDYKRIGETLDDAVGEAFDKVARLLGLSYPGGPALSTLANEGDPATYELPRPLLSAPHFDFSYSGLKTAVLYLIRDLTDGNSRPLTGPERANIAASFQRVAVDVLVRKAERAAQTYGAKSILLSGGVSANTLLRERMQAAARGLGIAYHQPELRWPGDNAAMIAAAGYFQKRSFSAQSNAVAPSWKDIGMDANLCLGT